MGGLGPSVEWGGWGNTAFPKGSHYVQVADGRDSLLPAESAAAQLAETLPAVLLLAELFTHAGT
jgi:hypothetical protein